VRGDLELDSSAPATPGSSSLFNNTSNLPPDIASCCMPAVTAFESACAPCWRLAVSFFAAAS